jgi:hypothetical protein
MLSYVGAHVFPSPHSLPSEARRHQHQPRNSSEDRVNILYQVHSYSHRATRKRSRMSVSRPSSATSPKVTTVKAPQAGMPMYGCSETLPYHYECMPVPNSQQSICRSSLPPIFARRLYLPTRIACGSYSTIVPPSPKPQRQS